MSGDIKKIAVTRVAAGGPASLLWSGARAYLARFRRRLSGNRPDIKNICRQLLAVSVVALLASCGGEDNPAPQPSDGSLSSQPPVPPPPPPPAATIIAASVFEGNIVPSLTEMRFLAPQDDSLSARSDLDVRLTFAETAFATGIRDRNNDPYLLTLFPSFSIDLITDGDDLIPLERNAILTWRTGRSFWDVVVGAGKVWREPGEDAWDRASLPITLISRRVGQAKNCIMQFLFTPNEVSNAYVQCSQETSPVDFWQSDDMHTLVPVDFQDLSLNDKQAEVDQFRAERSTDIEVRDWAELGPDAAAYRAAFNANLNDPAEMSFGGIYFDGVLYAQEPLTRHGTYPYPRDMRHGVFSVTKTMSGGLSLLYLAQKYGDEVFDARITEYVAPLATAPGWEGVTFEHALNMVTGTFAEENSGVIVPFINARTALEALQQVVLLGDAPPEPGTDFLYSSVNTFVLAYAMQKYVEEREGPGVNYWDLLQADVLDQIGVYNFPIQRTLEEDDSDGVPTLAWGAFPTADDAVKIALLMQNGGAHDGKQLLHRQRTMDATGQSGWPGYNVQQFVNVDYRHSFWVERVNVGGCEVTHHSMQGHGGNFVGLLSTGAILVRFADNLDYNWPTLVRAADNIVPCR